MSTAFVPGSTLGARVYGPLSRSDVVRYAGASGDFNPLHHDDEFARAAGFPGVFAMGMLPAGILSGYLADLVGPSRIRRFRVQFNDQVWPGDTLECRGTVTAIGADNRTVSVELECVRPTGSVAIRGTAEFDVLE